MNCNNCLHYELYKMVTSGKPYSYAGDIPCLTCSRFSFKADNFSPNFDYTPDYIRKTDSIFSHKVSYIMEREDER